ncbi:hypothetical protein JZ751_003312 [Albula glossodonta]|uniref:Uncharacterized protein n=1 Tax=Albula glossodonta TaxID=121402 RepID=A0A8T2N7Y6_9TELE|nr:hypothetical protein JZ751_003312 [Albula glossodonta]
MGKMDSLSFSRRQSQSPSPQYTHTLHPQPPETDMLRPTTVHCSLQRIERNLFLTLRQSALKLCMETVRYGVL